MNSADKLLARLLNRPSDTPQTPGVAAVSGVGLQVYLDSDGYVSHFDGPLRHSLAQPVSSKAAAPLSEYLLPHSRLTVEGRPADWQGQLLDLDFVSLAGPPLQVRGWVQARADGWILQLLDIGDLLSERQHARSREQCQRLATQIRDQLRLGSVARLPEVLHEQLQRLSQYLHIPSLALVLLDEQSQGWQVHQHYAAPGAVQLWRDQQFLGTALDSLNGALPQRLLAHEQPRLSALIGPNEAFAVPYRDAQGVAAWLLCAGYNAAKQAPDVGDSDWLLLAAAAVAPLLERLREHRHQLQQERLETLQALLGTGWWEVDSASAAVQLAPTLAQSLGLPQERIPLEDWFSLVHRADRAELRSHLQALEDDGTPLELCVRLQTAEQPIPLWYRLQGRALGTGAERRLAGFMLDISDIKNQQQQAAAAHARLDNLIASSPAVIYVQRYDQGALQPTFFSASLQPLLGWSLADCADGRLVEHVHPEDRPRYFERTRQLLREGSVSARYRVIDRQGQAHWLLDEAKLLRDDLGLPVEAVGLWLDVTDATLAAEQVKASEERYRMLVEDSPAMICRYRPDLTLTFGNRPLATYLECGPEQLPGVDLGNWMSAEQREAFVQRLAQLTPELPVSTAEINLRLPGREHAWWVWSDRGVFDEHGRLLEVQAVGRDNTEVRRAQQQLTQSAKMATLGEMATGLAHEINQPLNVMRMAIVNVLKRLSNGDAQIDYLTDKLKRIDAQVQRAARVVDHMRVFGRRSEIEQHPFNPLDAIDGTLSLLAEGLRGKGVELRIKEAEFQTEVRGYVDQLEQVLINLMVNARDALLSKREANRDLQPWIALHAERDEHVVRLWVEDNGGGIDPRLLERIFEPFFTTKPVGVGTGLGLSVSYGIIENMGGRLTVRNGEEGARFCIELPIVSND
ncbi:PAS/PAC sensor Signal transduction histidine kinase [Pseudomonas fluorescens]|uniref:histidine kinase n=1 Tax=Pseudomonas fluorescens TaxID=294 RepID=A0A448DMS5_PSEFL|nr:ATP-binding protein [Pseudomonas fluorescens]VEF08016.1 PAS/PAC sensor Signal transduction histidine kinase [Pseudomonas fluorescens]